MDIGTIQRETAKSLEILPSHAQVASILSPLTTDSRLLGLEDEQFDSMLNLVWRSLHPWALNE